MAGDYTRFTFRPERDHAGVLMQQGRVQLDADWNELVELIDRRLRAETVDVVGRCAVPRQTPTGFEILAAGGGYTIGIGRAYVDGLLAENRGVGAVVYEPVWGERIGTNPTPYGTQPYLDPAPNPPAGAGPHLCYLDVWEREVTAVENPDLVEPAVGVDTATRLQTVWQVRWLADVGAGVTCASDWTKVQKWVDLTRPSGARLTTAATGAAAPADPCLIEPTGGYRGTENRLYRIEIHDDGRDPNRPPSFKWSRDDGAVAAVIDSITDPGGAPKVRVSRIGRDEILRFHDGDWVELLDDVIEFSGAPGVMARIAPNGVDAATNTITLSGALAGPIDTGRHARIRRWDQRANVNARGVIEVSNTPLELELGLQVTLELEAGGSYHVGDYWVVAARTADASIDILTREPPRGIRHHFCRLAVLAAGHLTDCRVLYPPEVPRGESCDCDACVTPATHQSRTLTIQQAIDRVARRGGKVCLAAGVYQLQRPLEIRGARSLTLVGKGHQTILVHDARRPAIQISNSIEVTVRGLTVATRRASQSPRTPALAILVSNTVGTTIERCFVGQASTLVGTPTSGAAFHAGVGIALGGFLAETVIRENVVLADVGVGSATADRPRAEGMHRSGGASERRARASVIAPPRYLFTHGLFVEDNLLVCRRAGVDLGRAASSKAMRTPPALLVHVGDTRVVGNSLYGCTEVGILVSGLVLDLTGSPTGIAERSAARAVLIDFGPFGPLGALARLGASRLDVRENVLSVAGYGIYVGSNEARIAGNDLVALGSPQEPVDAITLLPGATGRIVDRGQIVGNRIRRFSGNGIVLGPRVQSTLVKLNTIREVGGNGIVARSPQHVAIENNELLDIGRAAGREESVAGIALSLGVDVRVTGNTISGVGLAPTDAPSRIGIELLACPDVQASGNEVSEIGPAAEFTGAAVGIEVTEGYERIDIAENVVRLTGGDRVSRSLALAVGSLDRLDRIRSPELREGDETPFHTEAAHRIGDVIVVSWFDRVGTVELTSGMLSVHGNELQTSGSRPAAEIEALGSCLFNDNRCRLDMADVGRGAPPVVVIEAPTGSVIADANHLAGPAEVASFLIDPAHAADGRPLATVLGNVSDGQIILDGAGLGGTPWADLNITT